MGSLTKTTQVQFRDCAKIGQAVKKTILLVTESQRQHNFIEITAAILCIPFHLIGWMTLFSPPVAGVWWAHTLDWLNDSLFSPPVAGVWWAQGLHDILHAIVMCISSVKTVLWLAVNLFSNGVAFNTQSHRSPTSYAILRSLSHAIHLRFWARIA